MPESAIAEAPVVPTEEEKKKKKKKKNFQSVTGVKFKDLILPLGLAGVSAISRPASRAAEVGLSAYRTFQAGKQVSRENEAADKMAAYFNEGTQELKDARDAATGAVEDPTQSGKWLFHGQEGPNIPTPTKESIADADAAKKVKFRNAFTGQEGYTPEGPQEAPFQEFAQQQDQAGMYNQFTQDPEQRAAMITQGIQADPTDSSVIQETIDDTRSQAILDYKQRVAAASAPYESPIRMSEIAGLMSETNPAYAGGLMMQTEERKEKTKDSLRKILALEQGNARGRADKFKYEVMMKDLDHASEADLIKMRGQILGNQWTIKEDKISGRLVAIDNKRRDKNGNPISHDLDSGGRSIDFIDTVPPENLLKMYESYVSHFVNEQDKIDAGSTEDLVRKSRIPIIRAIRERLQDEFGYEFDPIPGIDKRAGGPAPPGEGDGLDLDLGVTLTPDGEIPFEDPVGLLE